MTTTTLQKPLGNSGQTIQQLLRGTDFDNIPDLCSLRFVSG